MIYMHIKYQYMIKKDESNNKYHIFTCWQLTLQVTSARLNSCSPRHWTNQRSVFRGCGVQPCSLATTVVRWMTKYVKKNVEFEDATQCTEGVVKNVTQCLRQDETLRGQDRTVHYHPWTLPTPLPPAAMPCLPASPCTLHLNVLISLHFSQQDVKVLAVSFSSFLFSLFF